MDINTIRQKYIDFFVNKAGHAQIPPAPLIPPDDPTTLFTSSGMQQLVPYLKGEEHPMGTKLVNSQPCFRAEDIDEVGDSSHTTFFEMLGNWSLGDYFKQEQLSWFWEFLTQEIKLDKNRLHITIFEGDKKNNLPKDEESYQIWKQIGISDDHIHYYDAGKNWWSRAGVPDNMPSGEIGGPDSEVFYDFDPQEKLHIHQNSKYKDQKCHVNCECGRYLEIGNSVFMQYIKKDDGSFELLPKQNVDFGGGLLRIASAAQNQPDVFQTVVFKNIIQKIEHTTQKQYQNHLESMRIIADHTRAAAFMIHQGIHPSNKMQGYSLRRLIRRAAVKLHLLTDEGQSPTSIEEAARGVVDFYPMYFKEDEKEKITIVISEELKKFSHTLKNGLKVIEKNKHNLNEALAFDLFQSYGFPFEITQEIALEEGKELNQEKFNQLKLKHAEQSRTASAGMFKGGLADHSQDVTKLHTTTHLLHKALQEVLGSEIRQEGSNITSERLRFDYQYSNNPTNEQLKQIEDIINQKIQADLPVIKTIEDKDKAFESGAMAFFKETYPDKVSVYTIGKDVKNDWFSKELCGGPHVSSTGEIGPVTIKKDKSIGAGIRRIYVVLSPQNGNQKHSFKNQSTA